MRIAAGLLVAMLAAGTFGCGDDDDDSTGGTGGTSGAGGSAGGDSGRGGTDGAAGDDGEAGDAGDDGGAASGTGGDGGSAGAAGSGGRQAVGTGGAGAAGGTGGAGGQASGPDLDEIGPMLADAMCTIVEDCLGVETVERVYGEGKCVERVMATIDDGDFAYVDDAVAAGRVTYHPDRVEACLESIRSLGCALNTVRFFETDPCQEVMVGSVDVGGSCGVDAECIGTAFCLLGDSCPGICTAPLEAGQECEDDDDCQDGLLCSDERGLCSVAAEAGAPCGGTTGAECGLGLTCAGADEDEGTPGVCKGAEEVFVGALDEDCDFDSTTLCQEGLSCIISVQSVDGGMDVSFTCAEGVGSGQSCNLGAPTQCPSGEYCAGIDLDQAVVEGTCQPLPQPGQDCVDDMAGQCASGLVCDVDGKCHSVNRLGGDCASDQGCSSETCEDGVCVRPLKCEP